ncbi:GGDEF domain-containing response regulator [Paraliomyxa miuraensis]|uniref:GGDEF domain-containing response regulator n=1 Tax=Paraliomyxa miuraensis TaxID=376150 RepID=UPI002255E3E1|nr:response regulator [Paraliomyxa miuraensis]MCX4242270.1 response regulator [Paraliomyxa miuraensis]
MNAAAPQGAPAKVLVADDSDTERAAARQALTEAGYEVVEAIDGQHALEVFGRERPDLVLLDVVMPRLTGLETCRILKAKTQATYLPVIMVSTRNSVNARVEGLRSGADDYLGKPYDADELRARVEALLRTRKVLRDSGDGGRPPPLREGAVGDTAPRGDIDRSDPAFTRRLEEEFDRAERYSDPLTCLRVELDQYEAILTDHGSEVAGEFTVAMREVVGNSIRKIDLVYRAGDSGYLLVLPNTHFPGALAVAERVVRDIRKLRSGAAPELRTTVSVGVSFFPNKDTHSLQDMLQLVDAALDRARGEGGGFVCLYQHQGYLYRPED